MKNGLLENIAIIDGASTSAYLAPAFRAYGVKCTHIVSTPRLPQRLKKQLNSADYVAFFMRPRIAKRDAPWVYVNL